MGATGLIPRAHTCPQLAGGSSSPKSGSSSSLPSWRSPPRAAAAASSSTLGGRWALLAACAILYTRGLLYAPALFAASGAGGSGGPPSSAAADLPALARRAALLEQPAALGLWSLEGGPGPTQTPQPARVEYREAGNVVSLLDALNSSAWTEPSAYSPVPLPASPPPGAAGGLSGRQQLEQQLAAAAAAADGGTFGFPALCPEGPIRLFIGIASRCCTAEAQAKRDAIRRTWLAHTKQHLPGVHARFILAQPADEADLRTALELLRSEVQQHADLIIVPGTDTYRNLPSKTLQLLRYALSSSCAYTHVMKADDDTHLRPQALLDIIHSGQHAFSVDVQHDGSGKFDGREPAFYQSPWMRGMYLGQLDSRKESAASPRHGVFPGWSPNRDPSSKWYLPEETLPDAYAPLGVRWASGWGYVLSRDLAEHIASTAREYERMPEKKPLWWGRLWWEDIMVGALLRGVARVHHHPGFKAAWQECDPGTVLKHLDNDAPALQEGLYAQDVSGLWAKKSVICSSGVFQVNNHSDWRIWRNSLPDNQVGGFMR